jgi:tetratricopeptide (TPR) repeat protein
VRYAPRPVSSTVPEHIGPYRVLRPIATGGTAEVYEVQDPASGERLALKLLVAVATSLKRFNREYEAMIRLNHPSIVRVYHYGLHQGHPWLTMELLRGHPAQTVVKRSGKPGSTERTTEVLRIGYHLARAIHYLHDRHLVHRDLKSANVLVLPDERIKLLDFGAAALLDATEKITIDGEFVGTFAYASPEQISGRQVDHRSDLYSLGVLLYRLATGQRPFEADDPNLLARHHLHTPPPDPSTLAPGLDPGLTELVLQLLAKSPGDRPPSADHVAQTLERLHGKPFSSRSRLAVHEPSSVTRDAQHHALWRHLVDGPTCTMVLAMGEEGSDRIRFLETVRQAATDRGWGMYGVQMRPGQGLQRLIDALVQMGRDCDPDAARPLIEGLRSLSGDVLANPKDRATLRQLAASVVRLRTRGNRPILLAIQEVHRADSLAVDLLGGLRRALHTEETPLKLVASGRASQLDSGSDLVRRLGEAYRIALEPLTPHEVAIAVGNMLGRRPPPAELARRIHEITQGEPLYVEEAVQDLVDLGGIEADGSRLAWAEHSMDLAAPERARVNAERLLAEIPVLHRRVLEAMAVARDAVDPPVLARMLGWAVAELGMILGLLSQRGVLRFGMEHGPRPDWRIPVLAELVRQELHPARRAALYRGLAAASTGHPPTRGGIEATMAVGRTRDAVRAVVGLARSLVDHSLVRAALDLLQPVVDRLDPRDVGPHVAEVHLLHARCLLTVSPTDPTNARSIARARALAEELGDRSLTARAYLVQARMFELIGHYANASKQIRAAWEQRPPDDDVITAQVAIELARSARRHGDLPKAEQWIDQAIEAAERAQDVGLQATANSESAACMLCRGNLPDAERTLSRAMQMFERADQRAGFWKALARWATVLRHQGRYSEALSQLYQRLPESSQCQDPTPYTELLLTTAWVELDLSRLGRAQECTDELAATVHRGEHLHLRLEAQILKARILLSSGQFRNAQYMVQEVHRSARNADLPVLAERARALLAEVLYAVGDREQSAREFQSAILGLMGSEDLPALAEGCRARARTQATERDPEEIFKPVRRLLEEQQMPLLQLELLLARSAWHRAANRKDDARIALREAATVLNKVATDLSDTDRAALRVHPWSSWIRRALR